VMAVSASALLSDVLRKKADRVLLIDNPGDLHYDNFLS